jgi:hypothetical protein
MHQQRNDQCHAKQVSSAQRYHGSRQAQRFQTCKGLKVAGFQGSKVTGLQESKAAGFNGFKAQRFQSSGIAGSRALQRSKVAMSPGKVPRLHHDPKDAGFQGFRPSSKLKGSKILGFQLSRVPGFQNLSLQVFQGSMVRICRHMKQPRTPSREKCKALRRSSKGFLQRFRQRFQHHSLSKGSSSLIACHNQW